MGVTRRLGERPKPLRLHGERALIWHDTEDIQWEKLHELDTYGDEVLHRRPPLT